VRATTLRFQLWSAGVLLATPFFCLSASAQALYSTGFENPPFTTGPIAGQDGWQVFGTSGAAQIENTKAEAGSQALEEIPALDTGQTGPYHTDSTAAGMVDLSADIYIASSSNPSKWQFGALGATLTPFLGGMDVYPDGTIHTITVGYPTVGTWTYNAWNHVDLRFDVTHQTYSLSINGSLIVGNVANCGDNSTCTGGQTSNYGVGLFDTFGNEANNDIGYMDNFSVAIVPEPGTVTLLLLGLNGCLVVRRLRRLIRSRS
jgi:hypothetical protein